MHPHLADSLARFDQNHVIFNHVPTSAIGDSAEEGIDTWLERNGK
jgi:hypothetical protein